MKALLIVCCAVLFASADLIRCINPSATEPLLVYARYGGIGGALLALLIICSIRFQFDPRVKFASPLPEWLLFGSSVIVSTLALGEYQAALTSTWIILGAPLVYFGFLPVLLGEEAPSIVGWALILADLPFIVLSLASSPLRFPYSGITINPNSIGVLSVTISTGALVILMGSRGWQFFVAATALLGSLLTMVLSGSRTSIVAFVVAFVAWLALTIAKGSTRQAMWVFAAMVCAAFVVLALAPDAVTATYDGLLSKSYNYRQSFLADRDTVWIGSLFEPTLLGHGESYFTDTFGVSAHNSIVDVYGRYGIISAACFVAFGLSGFYVAWRFFLTRYAWDPLAGGPLIVLACFWGVSLGEAMFGMFAGSLNIAFLMCTGITQQSGVEEYEARDYDRASL